MLQTIIDAINGRKVLAFMYHGLSRVVEPHAVGVSRSGKDALRCWQTAGGHVKLGHEWDFCLLEEMSGLSATGASFAGERPGYKKSDKHLTRIYAEL